MLSKWKIGCHLEDKFAVFLSVKRDKINFELKWYCTKGKRHCSLCSLKALKQNGSYDKLGTFKVITWAFISFYFLNSSVLIHHSIYLSIYRYLSANLSLYTVILSIDNLINLSIDNIIYLSISLSVDLSIDNLINLSIDSLINLSIDNLINLSISLSINLSIGNLIYLSISLSVNLSIDNLINLSVDNLCSLSAFFNEQRRFKILPFYKTCAKAANLRQT